MMKRAMLMSVEQTKASIVRCDTVTEIKNCRRGLRACAGALKYEGNAKLAPLPGEGGGAGHSPEKGCVEGQCQPRQGKEARQLGTSNYYLSSRHLAGLNPA